MNRHTRLAVQLAGVRLARTLYHGTVVDNEGSIRRNGLIGQVGSFVEDAYGGSLEEGMDAPELVFAADKAGLNSSLTAMIHHIAVKLGKDFHDVTDTDILNHGLLVIMKDQEAGSYGVMHRPEEDENYRGKHPSFVEPGDYYAEDFTPDQFVKGRALLRLLQRYRVWPRDWSPLGDVDPFRMKKIRGVLIQNLIPLNPEMSKQEIKEKIDNMSDKDVINLYAKFRHKQKEY
jgi:hypothetical protein